MLSLEIIFIFFGLTSVFAASIAFVSNSEQTHMTFSPASEQTAIQDRSEFENDQTNEDMQYLDNKNRDCTICHCPDALKSQLVSWEWTLC